ncbi:MAG: GxxExxY protein [Betaproteobacteria bacterium]
MNADERRLLLDQVTEKVIGCVHLVSNGLGCGFLEKVYENALAVELVQSGLKVVPQQKIEVRYKGVLVGEYIADLVVEDSVIIEVKAVKVLEQIHAAQCLNYLKATGYHVCLLINFGTPKAGIKRIVHEF